MRNKGVKRFAHLSLDQVSAMRPFQKKVTINPVDMSQFIFSIPTLVPCGDTWISENGMKTICHANKETYTRKHEDE